jgi:hypothetical protein
MKNKWNTYSCVFGCLKIWEQATVQRSIVGGVRFAFHKITKKKKPVNLIKIRSLSAWDDLNNPRRITHVSYLTTSWSTQDTEQKLRVLRLQQTLN